VDLNLSNDAKGVIAIVISAIMYGFTGLFIRFLTNIGLNVYSINFVEYLIGIFLIYFIASRRKERIELPLRKEWLFFNVYRFLLFWSDNDSILCFQLHYDCQR
jgi:drug/metabolite transporter (DMT)-like permease